MAGYSRIFRLYRLRNLLEVVLLMDRDPDGSYAVQDRLRRQGVRLYRDSRTRGGVWRVVWRPLDASDPEGPGLVWVSCRGGYPHLQEELDLFVGLLRDAGAQPLVGAEAAVAGADPVFGG